MNGKKSITILAVCAFCVSSACDGGDATGPEQIEVTYERDLVGFPARLDSLRVQLRIPGLAAAIAEDGLVRWARGFGMADAEAGRAATASTPFHLASLTKPFASVILMQLFEAGLVNLDAPLSDYGVELSSTGVIEVRHLLTHTSEGIPGSQYHYSGNRFDYLGQVIQSASGRSFGELLVEQILQPLSLSNTAPNPEQPAAFALTGLNRVQFMEKMAAGYELRGGQPVPLLHPDYFGVSGGLVASAEDVAAFSLAIDEGRFLEANTWAEVFTPATSNSGAVLPYGLGWFIQDYQGERLQWHYGYWTTNSSLIVRVPERGLTFVVLANTPQLSAPYGLGIDNNVLRSDVARLFLEAFVSGNEPIP
jgi:CubicO group peptidase (beta-lactamase class C family)